jgi:hypothetical protein
MTYALRAHSTSILTRRDSRLTSRDALGGSRCFVPGSQTLADSLRTHLDGDSRPIITVHRPHTALTDDWEH